jgi:hypothetical protein
MALDVHVVAGDTSQARGQVRLQFQDDGYFWYLYDAFELVADQTRQRIDLYGDATFAGDQLGEFESVLLDWRARVRAGPSRWAVTTGMEIQRGREKRVRKVEDIVERGQMLALIDCLLALSAEARERNSMLFFFGD